MVQSTGVSRFLAACRHEQPDATPIWFMRQAGRCLSQYRELRKRYDILTMAKTPELCAQVTLMPVEQFGVVRARGVEDQPVDRHCRHGSGRLVPLDDHAPVEWLTDRAVLAYIAAGGRLDEQLLPTAPRAR